MSITEWVAAPAVGARGRREWAQLAEALRQVLPAYLISRGLVLAAAVAAVRLWPGDTDGGVWPGSPSVDWIAALSRWDGKWYMSIARDGYQYHAGGESNVAYSPLYPALIRLGAGVTGQIDANVAMAVGIAISNVALLAACLMLFGLVRELAGPIVARRTVVCLLAFPFSFFLSAVYPESLFLALAIGAYFAARRGHWALAGVLTVLVALTRTYGAAIAAPLAWEYLAQHRWRIRADAVWLLLAPLVGVLWVGYLVLSTGDPLVMVHAQEQFGRRAMPPWSMFQYYLSIRYWLAFVQTGGANQDGRAPVDLAFALAAGALVLLSWRLRPRSLGVFGTVFFGSLVFTGTLTSVPRYVMELFPAFIALAGLLRNRVWLGLYVLAAGGWGLYLTGRFALGWFVE